MSDHSKHPSTNARADKKYVKMGPALIKASANEIRLRAYQIWEKNGRQDHLADQDWFKAEQELLDSRRQSQISSLNRTVTNIDVRTQ